MPGGYPNTKNARQRQLRRVGLRHLLLGILLGSNREWSLQELYDFVSSVYELPEFEDEMERLNDWGLVEPGMELDNMVKANGEIDIYRANKAAYEARTK